MIQSSPLRTARVRSPATSEPASASVTAIEQTISPLMAGARYFCFNSWLPKRWSDGVAMLVCTPMAIAMPPASMRPNSSHAIAV